MFGNLIDGSQNAFTVRRVVLVGQIPRNCSESCGCMTINGREISGAACSIMGICLLFVIFLSLTFSITLSLLYPQFPAALYRGSASYCGDLCREVRRIFLYFEKKKKTIPLFRKERNFVTLAKELSRFSCFVAHLPVNRS